LRGVRTRCSRFVGTGLRRFRSGSRRRRRERTRFVRVMAMEIGNQVRSVISICSRFPGVISWRIAFPTKQVLGSLTFTGEPGVENLLDFILNLLGNNKRWRTGLDKGFDSVLCFGLE
jgi:hypothetical protein